MKIYGFILYIFKKIENTKRDKFEEKWTLTSNNKLKIYEMSSIQKFR